MLDKNEVRKAVRTRYAQVASRSASTGSSCCGGPASSCCGPSPVDQADASLRLGYGEDDLAAVPEGANLGLGCGNPQAIAALRPGEVVLDLGSGAGFDCFLAARQVGEDGRVIGVDMTPEMVAKARENAQRGGYENVDFRLGEIEHVPVPDSSVDVILSNCVINLSPDKTAVFREAFRVLRPGGRLALSDIVATAPLPDEVRADLDLLSGCIAGAAHIDSVAQMLADAGFAAIQITPLQESREFIREWQPGTDVEDYVLSASIQAVRPLAARPDGPLL